MSDLRVKDLVVEYANGDEAAIRPIDGLDLEATAGSLVVVLGPSGCGKTTLLSCLGGILSPTAGRIQFGDVEVTALDRRELTAYRRHTVGIVFQAFNLVASLTALENVMVPLWAAGWSRRAAHEVRSTSPQVAPGSTNAMRRCGSTVTPRIRERSMTMPPSVEEWPATLCPPPRTAISAPEPTA
jgi:ABC-type lipoprotein export system ATPase subunit